MPHEPVQVVTNPEQLRQPRETNPPGSAGTDFFEGNDAGFAAHRESLARALASIRATIASDAWLWAVSTFVDSLFVDQAAAAV